jgi:hypothetical protein
VSLLDLITTNEGQFFSVKSQGRVGEVAEEINAVIQKS